ncbi:hypothetical protein TNCV_2623881 [Trichonephila clavipes]|nr:hypothetical protein TNCV_2623881 [Trichonephila clavipes]
MDMYNKVLLYTAVLRPIISYGCPVWGYAAKTNVKILETAQNSIIRTITKANRYTRNSNIYKALKLHPFKKHAFSPFFNFGIANREVTHPVPPTNHSASYPTLSSQKTSLVSSSDYCVPPPTPYHHVNYNDSPASQSGSFMLRIQDSTTTAGNIHCSVMGRRNTSRSMSQ